MNELRTFQKARERAVMAGARPSLSQREIAARVQAERDAQDDDVLMPEDYEASLLNYGGKEGEQ